MSLYLGKVLKVDLTQKRISTEPLNQNFVRDYWGGWGLALRYFWDEVSPKVDPLSPENAKRL